MQEILVRAEIRQAVQVLREATRLLKLHAVDVPKEIVDGFIDLFNSGVEVFSIKQLPAVRTGELWFGLYASDRLLELMAALRDI